MSDEIVRELRGIIEAPPCDVTACQAAAVTCVVGEAGDFWLCAEHATPSGTCTSEEGQR